MAFAIADTPILEALLECRYLQSSQLARLTGRSSQVIRRRMRWLATEGFVVILRRSPTEEVAYALGSKGFEFIAFQQKTTPEKLPFSRKVAKVDSLFWRHTLAVNNTRIALTLAAQNHPHVVLHRTIPEWEMANPAEKDPTKKFVLWERLSGGVSRKLFSFRPDCMFLFYHGNQGPDHCVAMYLEADRGTESVARRINEKYTAFHLYYQKRCHWNFFKALDMRCLFVLDEVKTDFRVRTMQRQLQAVARQLGDANPINPVENNGHVSKASFVWCFRFTRSEMLNEATALDEDIWQNWRGDSLPLFNIRKLRAAR